MQAGQINPPIVLAFSSLDPSGCGGIQADIETAASLGCHCTPIVTCIGSDVHAEHAQLLTIDAATIIEQARSILGNMAVSAIKIGFLGSLEVIEAVHSILRDFPKIPVVTQAALSNSNLLEEAQHDFIEALHTLIVPQTSIASVSLYEAQVLAEEKDTVDTTGNALIAKGCDYALITGSGKPTKDFRNSLYGQAGLIGHYQWEQESLSDDGASSTLSASMASYIAHGFDSRQAVEQAQDFTWRTLMASRDLGCARQTPHRFFWADKNLPNDFPEKPVKHSN